jgi:hypothetical protein
VASIAATVFSEIGVPPTLKTAPVGNAAAVPVAADCAQADKPAPRQVTSSVVRKSTFKDFVTKSVIYFSPYKKRLNPVKGSGANQSF